MKLVEMRALFFIVLLFAQQGWAAEIVPPTDWQLLNLKGKVKKCVVRTVTSVVVKSSLQMDIVFFEEYVFDTNGYLQSKKKYKLGDGKRKYHIYTDNIVYAKYVDQVRNLTVYGASTDIVNYGQQQWLTPTTYTMTDKVDALSGALLVSKGEIDDKGRLLKEERLYEKEPNGIEKYSFITKNDYNKKGEKESYDIVDGLKNKEESYYIDITSIDRVGNPLIQTTTDDNDKVYNKSTFTYEYYK